MSKLTVPLCIVLFGVMVSIFVGFKMQQAEKQLVIDKLQGKVSRWISVMEFGTEKEANFAQALVSVFEDSPVIDEINFRELSNNALKLYPGLEALMWVPEVPSSERALFESAMYINNPDFSFKDFSGSDGFIPSVPADIYYPVYYYHGSDASKFFSGWNLGGVDRLGPRFFSAKDSESKITMQFIPSSFNDLMTTDSQSELKMLLVSPLQSTVALPDGSLQAVNGYILFLIRFSLVANYFSDIEANEKLSVIVNMGVEPNVTTILKVLPNTGELLESYAVETSFSNSATSLWNVKVTPTDDYFSSQSENFYLIVTSSIMLLSIALAVYLYTVRRRTLLIQELVDERTDELQKSNEELDRLSRTDYLTGVANRRFFGETLESEWSRAARSKSPVSLLMIDVDYFKLFNDHYGHLEGDDCLQQIAKALTLSIKRPADLVARFGGEEFVILLPDTNDSVMDLAELCRENVNKLKIEHQDSEVAPYITISIGVATMIPSIDQPSRILVKAADDALYLAKESGRNCVREC